MVQGRFILGFAVVPLYFFSECRRLRTPVCLFDRSCFKPAGNEYLTDHPVYLYAVYGTAKTVVTFYNQSGLVVRRIDVYKSAAGAPAGSASCDLSAPRRWFPGMAPFRVSALRPAPVLARLGMEADSADGDPVALETFSIVDDSLVWTLSAPPAGVRTLSRLVLRFLNPPAAP